MIKKNLAPAIIKCQTQTGKMRRYSKTKNRVFEDLRKFYYSKSKYFQYLLYDNEM